MASADNRSRLFLTNDTAKCDRNHAIHTRYINRDDEQEQEQEQEQEHRCEMVKMLVWESKSS